MKNSHIKKNLSKYIYQSIYLTPKCHNRTANMCTIIHIKHFRFLKTFNLANERRFLCLFKHTNSINWRINSQKFKISNLCDLFFKVNAGTQKE